MDVEVKIVGLQELEARLTELGALAGQKLVRRVLRKVAKPMADQAKANAIAVGRSGALWKSIAIYNRRPKGSEVARVAVGSRAGNKLAVRMHNDFYGRRRKGVFYGWMLDRGTARSRARPWWTPAVNATEGRATSQFVEELRKAVDRIERRKTKTASPDSVVSE